MRNLNLKELQIVQFMLSHCDNTVFTSDYLEGLKNLKVEPCNDGGMGSLKFTGNSGAETQYAKSLCEALFKDEDGKQVSISLSLDTEGCLYELDIWKTDFSPLLRLPTPEQITIIKNS